MRGSKAEANHQCRKNKSKRAERLRPIVNLRKPRIRLSVRAQAIARAAAYVVGRNQTWLESLSLRMRFLATRTDESGAKTREAMKD